MQSNPNPFDSITDHLSRLEQQYNRIESLLMEKAIQTPQTTTPSATNDLLTIREAASLLKMKVSSIYQLVHRREIPFIKRGKRLIFEETVLLAWVQTGRHQTIAEIENDARVGRVAR